MGRRKKIINNTENSISKIDVNNQSLNQNELDNKILVDNNKKTNKSSILLNKETFYDLDIITGSPVDPDVLVS